MQSYIYIYTVNENTLAPTIENLDIYIYCISHTKPLEIYFTTAMKMIVMIMLVKFETNLKLYTEVIRYLLQVYTYFFFIYFLIFIICPIWTLGRIF